MGNSPIWERETRTFVRVLVKPNSRSKHFVEEITENHILINLREAAREGKANIELIKKLAKLLRLSTSNIVLVAGHKNREKILAIMGITAEELRGRLSPKS